MDLERRGDRPYSRPKIEIEQRWSGQPDSVSYKIGQTSFGDDKPVLRRSELPWVKPRERPKAEGPETRASDRDRRPSSQEITDALKKFFEKATTSAEEPSELAEEPSELAEESTKPGMLEVAGKEAETFLDKTAQALVKWGAVRLVDLMAPGLGAAISAIEKIITVVQDIEALVTGVGEIGFPVAVIDGFEVRAEVHAGDEPVGRGLPVSAFIAPSDGDSLLDEVEIKPDSDRRYAAMISTDLSGLPELPTPASAGGVARSYMEQAILPELHRKHREEADLIELVYIYDNKAGLGAWMRISGGS